MTEIGINERFVLFVIQRSTGITEYQLADLADLPLESVRESIARLKSMGRVGEFKDGHITYYVAHALSKQPLFPLWEKWLSTFCTSYPQSVEGDTLGTMYACCGVVTLTALLSGSREPEMIARVTTLPLAFVTLVLRMIERSQLWWSDRMFHLEEILLQPKVDFAKVESALHSVKEQVWNFCWSPEIESVLHSYRERRQFNGQLDCWLEEAEG
jgi:hypothetical protein